MTAILYGARTVAGLATARYLWLKSHEYKVAVTKFLFILPVRCVLPLVWFVVLRRWLRAVQENRATNVEHVLRVLLRRLGRVYISLEAVFFVLYLYEKWLLSARVPVPHWPHKETRHATLLRVLEALDQVNAAAVAKETSSFLDSKITAATAEPTVRRVLRSSTMPIPSVGSVLTRAQSVASNLILTRAASRGQLTADSLLRSDHLTNSSEEVSVRLTVLKRVAITSWFGVNGANIFRYRRGNLGSFLAEAFFEGRHAVELHEEETTELEAMIDSLAQWLEVPDMEEGFAEEVNHLSLANGPLPAKYRPAGVYMLTHLILPQLVRALFRSLGFVHYHSGTQGYWLLRRRLSPALDAFRKSPIVFCHGLGVGQLPYFLFVRSLKRRYADRDIFLMDLPFIAMRPAPVPSSEEVCVCVEEMLSAWNYSRACFMGHSYGTMFTAWIVKRRPELISSLVLLDPVCFLLLKSDLALSCLFSQQSSPAHAMFAYWVSGELYISHTLTRNFRWHENNLWPEDLTSADFPVLVSISEADDIVPSLSVKLHLEANGIRPLWLLGASHGQILYDSSLRKTVLTEIDAFVSDL